ncbi:MAG TPA: ATP-binding protein [Roseiflexaceae bacterium]|nr:ATP-binding protein [Roseiflexaceae bacterium]
MLSAHQPQPTSLAIVTHVARLLARDHPFESRIGGVFTLLQEAIGFHDGRLTCWLAPDAAPRQIYAADGWQEPWSDEPLRAVVEGRAPLRRVLPAGARGELVHYAAPIAWDERLWGVLELRALDAEALGLIEQTMVSALTPLLAVAIAGEGGASPALPAPRPTLDLTARQEQALQSLRAELEGPHTLGSLLGLVLRWALDTTGAEAGAVSLVDHERGELVLQVYDGYGRDPFTRDSFGEPRRRVSWDTGVAGKVARSGRAILLRDVTADPDYLALNPDIRAELALPIAHQGRVLAVLVLDSPRSAAFGDFEVGFAQALCAAATGPLLRALRYQELLETSTQLGQVFSSMPSGLVLLDKQGKVLRHNPAFASIWGLDERAIGESFHMPWDLVPLLIQRLADPLGLTEFCTSGQRSPAEVQATTVRLRNPHQELQLLSVPTRDSLNQLTGRLLVVSDVTREREADRLKSEFVSVVSHELRTPLTSILGYTELLLARDFAPAEQREFVQTVYNEANHLSQIVEDLLGFSRLEAGAVRLNQWTVSLRQLITELTAQLNIHLSNRHRMVIDIPERLPPAYIDRDKIRQVLFNLLTNAAKYSPRGGQITLAIAEATPADLPPDHPEGYFIRIAVSDQGLGIPKEDLPRIWDRFFRVDNSNTRRIGGTGLGLAIAKALVELHGGRIWADSVLGQGSTFTFTVPAAGDRAIDQNAKR